MDDHEPVCLLLAEERFAYPAEVGKVLLLKVDAGADARMDEEIVAETERVGQPLQKLPMRWRHAVLDEPDARLPVHSSQFLGIYPIAFRAFRAAELDPGGPAARLALAAPQPHLPLIAARAT